MHEIKVQLLERKPYNQKPNLTLHEIQSSNVTKPKIKTHKQEIR